LAGVDLHGSLTMVFGRTSILSPSPTRIDASDAATSWILESKNPKDLN